VGFRRSQILHLGVEVAVASETMVLGIGELNVPRLAGNQVTEIVEPTDHRAKTIGTPAAIRTRSMPIVPTPLADLGLGQVFYTNDALGLIRNVPSWPGHGNILHESQS